MKRQVKGDTWAVRQENPGAGCDMTRESDIEERAADGIIAARDLYVLDECRAPRLG
jgi:hypothetical protein